jgi:hypothetical protein
MKFEKTVKYSEDDLKFDPVKHRYSLHGTTLPGVTSILESEGLVSDFCKSERAAAYGTAVHAMIRLDIVGKLDEESIDPGLFNPLRGWKDFREANPQLIPVVDRCEKPTFHPLYMYAGTPDLLFMDTKTQVMVLYDIKTSLIKYSDTWELQTAGYEHMLRHWIGLRPIDLMPRRVLWLSDKEPVFDIIHLEDTGAFPAFIGMVNSYKWKLKYNHIQKAT